MLLAVCARQQIRQRSHGKCDACACLVRRPCNYPCCRTRVVVQAVEKGIAPSLLWQRTALFCEVSSAGLSEESCCRFGSSHCTVLGELASCCFQDADVSQQ
jgi:hypothetical protein